MSSGVQSLGVNSFGEEPRKAIDAFTLSKLV
ncbi:MAG: hypothetical protein ACI92S_003359 [Planctomycetaceae bacterium]|jgi:hypothetical protein